MVLLMRNSQMIAILNRGDTSAVSTVRPDVTQLGTDTAKSTQEQST